MENNSQTDSIYNKWLDKSDKKDEKATTESIKFVNTIRPVLFDSALNLLLLCAPVGIVSYFCEGPKEVTFIFSLIALCPLAERLGFVTEQLAMHTNETVGGLLNATFGNAPELIVAITALKRGLFRLVQLSLLGSILSNMLLVLGCAFLAGGCYFKTQTFGTISSQMNSTLLMLSVMGILFPTILTNTQEESNLGELGYSRATALMLFLLYIAFLYFQLFTHAHLYEDEATSPMDISTSTISPLRSDVENSGTDTSAPRVMTPTGEPINAPDDDDEEEDVLGWNNALIWLAIVSAMVAILSDAISDSIEDAAQKMGISKVFIAAIVLPITGNAAEHASAVIFATKGKLDLSLGVAIGSSTQIALCVLPFVVLVGWMGGYDLSMNFGGYEAGTMLLTVIAVTFAIKDGKSNWLLGAALITAYFIIAVGFWAHNNQDLDAKD